MAPTSNPFNLGPVSLILYPPISLTLYYSLDPSRYYYPLSPSRRYYPKFSSSSLEYGALNYQIIAYSLALPIISIQVRIATVIATGQSRPSLIVMPIVIPIVILIVTPTATPIVVSTVMLIVLLDLTMLIKRPLKYSFIRIKTIYQNTTLNSQKSLRNPIL